MSATYRGIVQAIRAREAASYGMTAYRMVFDDTGNVLFDGQLLCTVCYLSEDLLELQHRPLLSDIGGSMQRLNGMLMEFGAHPTMRWRGDPHPLFAGLPVQSLQWVITLIGKDPAATSLMSHVE